jgi:hypothetical protein
LTEDTIEANAPVLSVGVPLILAVLEQSAPLKNCIGDYTYGLGHGRPRGVVGPILWIVAARAIQRNEGVCRILVQLVVDGFRFQLFLHTVVTFLPIISTILWKWREPSQPYTYRRVRLRPLNFGELLQAFRHIASRALKLYEMPASARTAVNLIGSAFASVIDGVASIVELLERKVLVDFVFVATAALDPSMISILYLPR